MSITTFDLVRRGGQVRRYHTAPMIGHQTVAEHTYGVVCIIMHLWPDSRPQVIQAALYHDTPEYLTGDSPAPAKREYPALWDALHHAEEDIIKRHGLAVELTEEEKNRVKLADLAELVMTAAEQIDLGNRNFRIVFERGVGYIRNGFGHTPDGIRVLQFLETWQEYGGHKLSTKE